MTTKAVKGEESGTAMSPAEGSAQRPLWTMSFPAGNHILPPYIEILCFPEYSQFQNKQNKTYHLLRGLLCAKQCAEQFMSIILLNPLDHCIKDSYY